MSDNAKTLILFVWPLALLLAGLSFILMYEDYMTSRAGYEALPTQKVNDGLVIFAVAALPQVAQIVLFFVFGRDTRKNWAIGLAFAFFLADLGTDAWYKSGGDWLLMPLAIVESLFIFTLGSEVLFTIAVGFLSEAFPEFLIAFSTFIAACTKALGVAFESLGLSGKEEGSGADHRRQ
jgi:hypothetical protein